MEDRDLTRWRMHSMGLAGPGFGSASGVVDGLLALQAENLAQSRWAIGCRGTGLTDAGVRERVDAGELLRTHVLRPTWHLVRPDDIRWLIDLTAPRLLRVLDSSAGQIGLDNATLTRSLAAIDAALAEGAHMTRPQLAERLDTEGLPSTGLPLSHILMYAELGGAICSGVSQDDTHAYAPMAERAPNARRLDRDDALVEIARRYATGHGPVTARDLAYWATLTLTDARRGLREADGLERFDHDGCEWWSGTPAPSTPPPPAPTGHVLQLLDEFHNGVQDTRFLLDLDGKIHKGRSTSVGMVLVDGQVIGHMRRRTTSTELVITARQLRTWTDLETDAVRGAVDQYATFLGLGGRLEGTG